MMIRAVPADPFSFGDAAAVLVGLLVVGAVIFFVSMSAENSPPISEFLHRTQAEADASRFQDLLSALGEPQHASQPLASPEHLASHAGLGAGDASTVALASKVIRPDETEASPRYDDTVSRSELQAMYERAVAPGVLKPHKATSGLRQSGLDL